MDELRRILLGKASPLERRLLQGGMCEQPTLRTCRRMARALGLSPLIAYTSRAKALLSSWSVQAGLGIALAAGVTTLGESGAPPSEPAVSTGSQRAALATPIQVAKPKISSAPFMLEQHSEDGAPAPAMAGPERARHTQAASTKRATRQLGKSKLALEISLIDRARTLIAHGRADRALLVLDEYRNAFPQGVLAPEAELLRRRAGE
jgi:hypothetical protein